MIITPSMEAIAALMFAHARSGWYDGQLEAYPGYFNRARRFDLDTGTNLILTRDIGMHTSGWFKNPDYDKCWHLSLSFWKTDEKPFVPDAYDMTRAEAWVKTFFPTWTRFIWHEGPSGRLDLPIEAHHYRVMVNEHWYPILPRLEVYSMDFTEKGWKTFSAVQAEHAELLKQLQERLNDD